MSNHLGLCKRFITVSEMYQAECFAIGRYNRYHRTFVQQSTVTICFQNLIPLRSIHSRSCSTRIMEANVFDVTTWRTGICTTKVTNDVMRRIELKHCVKSKIERSFEHNNLCKSSVFE